jgi:hypothetical protein
MVMAKKITVYFKDGTSHTFDDVPDTVTQAEADARAAEQFGKEVGRQDVTVTRIGDREIKPPESNRDLLDALRTAGGKAVRAVGPYAAAGAAGAAAGAPLMGVGAIPGAIAGMTAYGLGSTAADLMTGGQASQGVENLMTRAGLPEYDTALERMASSGVRSALGGFAGAQSAAALQAARGTVPQTTTQRIIDIMAQSPGAQTAGAGIAGVTAQGAREVGLPEPFPSLAGMAAGTAPFVRMGSFRSETPPVQPGGATRPPANAPTPPISGAATGRPALTQPPVTPMPPQDVRMGNVARLERAGVPVSPGQRSGAPLTQTVESVMKYLPPSAPRSARFMDDQMRSYTKALLSHAGINADTATPDVLSTAQRRFGDIYNDLEQSTVLGGPDEKMIGDLARAEQIVGQGAPQNIKDSFIGYRDAVLNWASGTPRQGQTFKGLAEDLGAEIRKAERSNEAGSVKNAQALITLRNALFGLVERQASPELANAWRQVNREYAIFKAIEDSMLDPSQVTLNTGFVNPRKIGNIQMKLRSDEWTQGDEDADSFTNLVKAGMALIPDPIPNSGTAQRMFAQDILQGGRQMFNSPAGPAIGAASGAAGMTGFGAASAFDPISAFGIPYLGSRFWYGDAPQSLRPIAAASAVGSQQRQKTKREKLAEELKRKRQ